MRNKALFVGAGSSQRAIPHSYFLIPNLFRGSGQACPEGLGKAGSGFYEGKTARMGLFIKPAGIVRKCLH
jgi:hypothetical protein